MIVGRFAAPTALLLSFSLIPTVIHNYRGLKIDDGLSVSAIPERLAGMPSRPTGRRATWGQEVLGSEDWLERIYRVGSEEVRLFAARSYDAKRLYHHPELAVLRGFETEPAGRAYLPGRADVPIHLLTVKQKQRAGLAVYALIYDRQYVENPILFQVRTSGKLLFGGRRAMTLLLASGLSGSVANLEKASATRVLTAAVEAFESQHP